MTDNFGMTGNMSACSNEDFFSTNFFARFLYLQGVCINKNNAALEYLDMIII